MPILGIIASSITGNLVTNSYESISTVTVGAGGAADITFSSIPSTYKHLQIRAIMRSAAGASVSGFNFQLNGVTTTSYAFHRLRGDGSTAAATASVSDNNIGIGESPADNATASIFGGMVLDVLDYTNTNKNKTTRVLMGHDANGSGSIWFSSGLYFANTNAVSSIKFYFSAGSFKQYSHFALYGIRG